MEYDTMVKSFGFPSHHPNHTVMSMVELTSPVWTRHVSDGDWGILTVYPTHQTDRSVSRWCSTCGVHCVKIVRIDLEICQTDTWGDTRIKKIVEVLVVEGIKISITTDISYSYVTLVLEMVVWTCLPHSTLLISLQNRKTGSL